MRDYRSESFWLDTLGSDLSPRRPLDADGQCDVAIVGAGFTGLWTAHALKRLDPSIDVALCDSDIVGAGASGRNGGWCMAEMSGLRGQFDDPEHRETALRLQRQLFHTVEEMGRVVREEGIDCDFVAGGALKVASVPAHRQRLEEQIAELRALGFGEDCYRLLNRDECAQRIRGREFHGAMYSRHVAALNPARLVRGLATALEARGVRIYEQSPVRRVDREGIETDRARLRADRVVVATEGYASLLPTHRRRLIPVHSMMIATEPLSEEIWRTIGLEGRETFADARRIVTYGQRTADGRIAFGSRGSYYYGSRVRNHFSADDPAFDLVREALLSILPQLEGVRMTHRWGGPLGVPRDWRPRLGIDQKTGVAFGGGYVGEGVAAAHWVGSTLADLLCGRHSERTAISWLQTAFPSWEREPLRWLGVSAVRKLGEAIDRTELQSRAAHPLATRIFTTMAK